jgi:hypothetical protein
MADSVGNGFPRTGIQEGHLHFRLDENALYMYIGGNPAVDTNWVLVANLTTNGTIYNYRSSVVLQDDFVTGFQSGSGAIGVLGWFAGGGVSTQVVGVNNIGISRRDTSAVANTISYMLLSGAQMQIDRSLFYKTTWIVRLSQVDVDMVARIGMTSGGTVSPTAGAGAFFEKSAGSGNWLLVTVLGGVAQSTDSGIVADTDFHVFTIVRDPVVDNYSYYIDYVLVGVRSTNMPNTGVQPFVHIVNLVAASKIMDIDYFEIIVSGIVR